MNKISIRIMVFVLICLFMLLVSACNTRHETPNNEKISNDILETDVEISAESIAFSVKTTPFYTEKFEETTHGFLPHGTATLNVSEENAYEGNKSLAVTGRTSTWNGAEISLGVLPKDGKWIQLEAWIRQDGPVESIRFNATIKLNGETYIPCGSVVVKKGEWTKIDGCALMPHDAMNAILFFETSYKPEPSKEDFVDFQIDDIVISEVETTGSVMDMNPLYEKYIDDFSIGCGVTDYDLNIPKRADAVTRHFNSITMGNEMKPDYILDYETSISDLDKYNLAPAINTKNMDIGLKFAQEHEIGLRYHTIVWHQQTPLWFFKENYSKDPESPFVSREVMLSRMESYIQQVVTYCQEKYPGVVYCYDVVNEAIEVNDGEVNGIRIKDNPWFETIGSDYVEMAFVYARKYTEPGIQLYYNDYNCTVPSKLLVIQKLASDLYQKGILDGVGMQGHVGMTDPTTTDFQNALAKFGEIGLKVQITELDIGQSDNTQEALDKLASRYKRLMTMFLYVDEHEIADITNITVWGLTDDHSWLNNESGTKYPLLFDKYLQPKAAFYGFVLDKNIPLNQ